LLLQMQRSLLGRARHHEWRDELAAAPTGVAECARGAGAMTIAGPALQQASYSLTCRHASKVKA